MRLALARQLMQADTSRRLPDVGLGSEHRPTWKAVAVRATPYVRVDPETLRSNIAAMQHFCDSRGLALRPHIKTHKSIEIARLQLSEGAVGLSVATVGEAEVFADTVAERGADVLIAYPVAASAVRLGRLGARVRTIVGIDSREGIGRAADAGVAVSIEVDSGLGRTGVRAEDARSLAEYAKSLGVTVTGVFTFPGHGYGMRSARRDAASAEAAALRRACDGLRAAGIKDPVASGGSTPTSAFVDADVVTELRPGVYVFMDAGQLALGAATPEQVALTVRTTVISNAVPNQVVLDAGAKVLGMDRPGFVATHGILPAYPGTRLARLWEHHAVVETPDGVDRPVLGEQVDVVPNHVCATVNLVDELIVGNEVWQVAARGHNA